MFTNYCARCGKIEKAPYYATPYYCAACEGEPGNQADPPPVVVLVEPERETDPKLEKGETGLLFSNVDLLTNAPELQ